MLNFASFAAMMLRPKTDGRWVMPLMYEDLSNAVIGAAIEVHKQLGPGFLESIYEQALSIELAESGLVFEREAEFTVLYNEIPVGKHRLDLLVEGKLVVELKATARPSTMCSIKWSGHILPLLVRAKGFFSILVQLFSKSNESMPTA